MAKKPKQIAVEEGAIPPLSPAETVAIRITRDGVHDGLGGVWAAGQVAHLPREIADVFIAKDCGAPADGADIRKAKADAAATLAKVEASTAKAGAQARLRSYDDAPKIIRDLAKEFGDEIVSRWELGEDEDDILKDYMR